MSSPPRLVELDGHPVALFSRGEKTTALGIENLAIARGPTRIIELALATTPLPKDLGRDEREAVAQTKLSLTRPTETPQHREGPSAIVQLNIANTLRCNLACTYCYNELGSKQPSDRSPRGDMTLETAKQAVRVLIEQSGSAPRLSLLFIGGESLLQPELCREAVSFAKSEAARAGKHLSVVVYTNGIYLNGETIDWANQEHVTLVVSLDGPPEEHDAHRRFPGGAPSSGIVLRNIRELIRRTDQRIRRVRSVATSRGPLLPLHQYLFRLGFNSIEVIPAYGASGYEGRNRVEDIHEIASWVRSLLLDGTVIDVHPFTGILTRLGSQGSAIRSWFPCGVGLTTLGVGPDGAIYPCHHFIDEPRFALGNLSSGPPTQERLHPLAIEVNERDPCRSCWGRHLCGGDCYHRALTIGGSYGGTVAEACAAKLEWIEAAIELFADVQRERPEALVRLVNQDLSVPVPDDSAYRLQRLRG